MKFADMVRDDLMDNLKIRDSFDRAWDTEYAIGNTQVDIAGVDGDEMDIFIELEMTRQDPVNNTAKLCRHVRTQDYTAFRPAIFIQVFSEYYRHSNNKSKTKSSKANATFVGNAVTNWLNSVSESNKLFYHPMEIGIDPNNDDPNKQENTPAEDATLGWHEASEELADEIREKHPV